VSNIPDGGVVSNEFVESASACANFGSITVSLTAFVRRAKKLKAATIGFGDIPGVRHFLEVPSLEMMGTIEIQSTRAARKTQFSPVFT
jgi:hypothetical protein